MAAHVRNYYFWQPKPVPKQGQTVLITGAASGIGREISLIYARRQSRLILVDRDSAALSALGAHCRDSLGLPAEHVLTYVVDVTNQTQVNQTVEEAIKLLKQLDVLVLCAGIGAHHLFSETPDLKLFHQLMNVNFYGYLHFVHAAHRYLCASQGLLLAITSFSGEVGLPYRTAYCASKFAATGFLESLRSELRVVEAAAGRHTYHITICCPPTVNTNLRKNSLTTNQNLKEAPSKNALSVDECALAIVDAGDRRLRKAFFPFQSWAASYLRPLIPDVMDQFIMNRAKL